MSGRDGAGVVELDGVLYKLGGWNTAWTTPGFTTNEFAASYDGGRTWTLLPPPPFEGRHTFGLQKHRGKIYVIGGDANRGHYQTDMWSWSPTDGWNLVMAVVPPLAQGRVLFLTYDFNDKLWIAFGQTLDEFITNGPKANRAEGPYYDDVYSWEEGEEWNLETANAGVAPMGMMQGNAVKDHAMWVIGGGAYDTQGLPRVYRNCVFKSFDGRTWLLVALHANFIARQYHSIAVLGREFVLLAGYNGANLADAGASENGEFWRPLPWPEGAPARHATSVVTYRGEALMMDGPLTDTAIWAMN